LRVNGRCATLEEEAARRSKTVGVYTMPWLTKRSGQRYYYTNRRVQGRQVRSYVGTGDAADQVVAAVRSRQAERAKRRSALLAQLQSHANGIDGAMRLAQAIDMLTKSTLVGLGFHQHDRGEWRRRRHVQNSQSSAGEAVSA
jgi:hypothetical protein